MPYTRCFRSFHHRGKPSRSTSLRCSSTSESTRKPPSPRVSARPGPSKRATSTTSTGSTSTIFASRSSICRRNQVNCSLITIILEKNYFYLTSHQLLWIVLVRGPNIFFLMQIVRLWELLSVGERRILSGVRISRSSRFTSIAGYKGRSSTDMY